MKLLRTTLSGLAGTAMLAAATFAGSPASAQEGGYLLATAGTGGTYYPVGVAIATLVKVKLENSNGISMSAITSAGSGENVKLLRENQAQFAIIQGLWGAYASRGEGPLAEDGVQGNLRAITMLWPNVEHFTIRSEYADTGTIDDLVAMEGHGFAIGARNSGTEGSNRHILAGLGIEDADTYFELAFVGYTPSVEAFQNGTIDALNPTAGVPVGAMTQLMAQVGDEATILAFTDEQVERANGGYTLWTPYVIPAGTYPGQEEDVRTIAQPNFLAVNADVDEEHVYLITKAIYENLPFLVNIHPATGAMSLDSALAGLPLPLHPGAVRYFEEAGVDVPDSLRP
ncbi:MAG: TAXI family TRAP transporter solute-binding subunit [Rhodospirillaceae bacterium]|nr:TAXI family TRAP transporter solute-binding subunit [Rhodospirillaceae bacterium]